MENQETKEPHIKIFNKEVVPEGKKEKKTKKENKEKSCMHCSGHKNRGCGLFGLTILFMGVLLLLNNFGVVSREIWDYIWPFWPIILILIGIRIMTGFNRIVGFFVFIVALVLFSGIVLYSLIQVGSPLVNGLYLSQGAASLINQLNQLN